MDSTTADSLRRQAVADCHGREPMVHESINRPQVAKAATAFVSMLGSIVVGLQCPGHPRCGAAS